MSYPIEHIRKDFPILATMMNGEPLAYLDTAATSQKPQVVIDAISRFYSQSNANIHRGVYKLSQVATDEYEQARATVAQFLRADTPKEIIFTKGATESINLVATSWGRANINAGDEIIATQMEHHANFVPWQLLCQEKGANLISAPIDQTGELNMVEFKKLINNRTKLIAIAHVSNALGTINPIKEVIELAHRQGILVLIDGAQAVQHLPIDVQELDADFYVFSGHKLYAPTGIGVLYSKLALLEAMPPYQSGGDMIEAVSLQKTTFAPVPQKFEAGTPPIAAAVGLDAAIKYVQSIGIEAIAAHEISLREYAEQELLKIVGVQIIGTAKEKAGVISFIIDGLHPHDIGTVLDQDGIAIRTGQHCAQPIMEAFGVSSTCRISIGLYTNKTDIDRCIASLRKAQRILL